MMKKRTDPNDLVKSVQYNRNPSWWDKLPDEDKEYVRSVVEAMRASPGSQPYLVAQALIKELSLARSAVSVVKVIKELLNEEEKP
jgi:hypothetical protein